jgi:hypothetical protein
MPPDWIGGRAGAIGQALRRAARIRLRKIA